MEKYLNGGKIRGNKEFRLGNFVFRNFGVKAVTQGLGQGVEFILDPTSETTQVDPLNPGWY